MSREIENKMDETHVKRGNKEMEQNSNQARNMVTPGTIKQIELTQSVNDEKPIKITKERS